eukprot:9064937-Pyramimonas_sp.AAC.1
MGHYPDWSLPSKSHAQTAEAKELIGRSYLHRVKKSVLTNSPVTPCTNRKNKLPSKTTTLTHSCNGDHCLEY